MKAYVSLHTATPDYQIDNEVSYAGYKRMEVDYDEDFGVESVNLFFPIVEEDSPDVVTYIAIGAVESGQGEIFMRIPAMPNIELVTHPERLTVDFWTAQGATVEQAKDCIEKHGYTAPHICIVNTNPITLPENINPIARVMHKLIYSGLIHPSDMHPKLYEAMNDALHNAGVPIIPVVRGAVAKMTPSAGLGMPLSNATH